jgi:hypothetical protein
MQNVHREQNSCLQAPYLPNVVSIVTWYVIILVTLAQLPHYASTLKVKVNVK